MRIESRDRAPLTLWAADCAERALPCFEREHPRDYRPRRAVEAGRGWARGRIKMGEARAAAFAAHAAAREAEGEAARAAARAAGHAAATAHVAAHALHAADYALKAVTLATGCGEREREQQIRGLPERLRPAVFPGR